MSARGQPRAYPPPPACDVLDWREAASVGGVYGVGLQLDVQPPPAVQRVLQLLDPEGEGEEGRVRGEVVCVETHAPASVLPSDEALLA